jgi:hypothetical protein
MLVTIQFPLADIRPFVCGPSGRVSKPAWPDAHPGGEFVRGVGGVEFRRLGGLNGWVGEGTHCEASRLVALDRLPAWPMAEQRVSLSPESKATLVRFRRLFADGMALVKYEIGFSGSAFTPFHDSTQYDLLKTLRATLDLPCRVRGRTDGPLAFLGRALAARYRVCTTKRPGSRQVPPAVRTDDTLEVGDQELVFSGDPLVFIDAGPTERIQLPRNFTSVAVPENFDFQLFYGRYAMGALRIPIWIMLTSREDSYSDQQARHLRIYLQRLHAEKEVLRLVLNGVASGRVNPEAYSEGSNLLQKFLLECTRRVNRLELKADEHATAGTGALAASCLEFVQPGWRDGLMQRLELLSIRPNIKRKVEGQLDKATWNNYVVVNIDQLHSDNRKGTFMGDIFSNIHNSTIINRSLV